MSFIDEFDAALGRVREQEEIRPSRVLVKNVFRWDGNADFDGSARKILSAEGAAAHDWLVQQIGSRDFYQKEIDRGQNRGVYEEALRLQGFNVYFGSGHEPIARVVLETLDVEGNRPKGRWK